MKNNFEFKHSFSGVDYQYARGPIEGEREIHTYHEILYLIDGDVTLLTERTSKKISPNSLIIIPKESYHFFKCDNTDRFERLKISFTEIRGFESITSAFSQMRFFENVNGETSALLNAICKRLQKESCDHAFIFGALLILLSSLGNGEASFVRDYESKSMARILSYINSHLSTPISTQDLAAAVNVSPSTLSHTFKEEMGISLHKYITQKRMILAKKLIDSGQLPTKIYSDCGFGDYSSFYKAYTSYFGHSPSKS